MSKYKTSIYIDRGLWEKFKAYARKKGVEVSRLLEELLRDELIDDVMAGVIDEGEAPELDFEPIKPREGLVSSLIRRMRDERASNLSGQ